MFKPGILAITCILFFAATNMGSAQVKCKITHYSTEDGLSHNRVICIIKDRDGFMWFGTWNGLNRFDGHNFVVYKSKPGDTSSLKNDRIQELVEDRSGYLWLRSYDNRVYRFDKIREQFLAIRANNPDGSGPVAFSRIVLSKAGQIWLTTANNGLFQIADPGAAHPKYTRYATDIKGSHHLASNTISAFYEDSEHNVWINSPVGICCLRRSGNDFHPVNISAHPVNGSFTAISDTRNRVWLPTTTGQLFYVDKATGKVSALKVSDSQLNGIYISRNTANVYLSAQDGRIIIVNRNTLGFNVTANAGHGRLGALYEDHSGLLWIEPEKYGIVKYNPVNNTFKYFVQKTDAYYDSSGRFFRLTEDENGLLWVSMENGGFGYYNKEKDAVDYFYNEPGAGDAHFSNVVIYTYADPSGVLWFSADDKGVNKVVLQRHDFNQQLVVPGSVIRSDNEIRGIYNDQLNRLWLASKSGGLFVYKQGKQIPVTFKDQPRNGIGVVYKILQDASGAVWLGTKGNGLFKATPLNQQQTQYQLTHYTASKTDNYSLSSNVIYTMLLDSKQRLWVGSYENGINLVTYKNNGSVQFLNEQNTFKNYPKSAFQKVRHLQEDASGRLWIASTDGLLIADVNGKTLPDCRFATYSKKPGDRQSLGNNDVQYIFRDARNRMWVATSGGGVNQAIGADPMRALRFRVYTTSDGLPSDYILSCIGDRRGNLWLSTENGLSWFNPDSGVFKNYDSYDGLPNAGFSEGSSIRLPDGRLVFGSINGYVTFDPQKVSERKINANMVFTNLQVNNEDVSSANNNRLLTQNINNTSQLELPNDHNIIGLDYAVLDYRSDNKQVYAYRLSNFDNTWHYNKGLRRATYTNLPPGKYRFEVKCTNATLYNNLPYKSLAINILPPWWRTWWAYLIYVVLAAAAMETARRIAFTMLRLRQRVAVEKRLADLKVTFFTNVSHELRTPLTLILNPIEEIFKKEKLSAEGAGHINVVRKNAKRMVHFINQLLDLRKVQSGKAAMQVSQVELVSFVHKIAEYFADVAAEKKINFKIEADARLYYAWIDAEKMDIVIYNLLSNAFKFTPPQKNIRLHIGQSAGDLLTISVIDEGEGVPEDKLNDIFELYYEGKQTDAQNVKGTGIGLALSKEFVELHHGQITALNNTAGGLTVSIRLMPGKAHFDKNKVVFVDLPEIQHQSQDTVSEMLYPAVQGIKNTDESRPLVLLVEDNQDLRMFLNVQLSEFYRVEMAVDGLEGLEKARALLPDLVLSDVMMPRMDGIQMLDNIKNSLQTSHIPVVLLSAKFSVENQIEGLRYGADYYITKPFHNDFLLASIDNLIRQRKKIFEHLLSGKRTMQLAPGEIEITSHDEQFLKKVIQLVEERMGNPEFNIDDAAEAINMSRSTFFKKFKSLTGQPPVEFVREMRLKRAAQMLDAGEYNIAEIAYTVGFSNNRYFSTCFKEHFGISPSAYIKQRLQKV